MCYATVYNLIFNRNRLRYKATLNNTSRHSLTFRTVQHWWLKSSWWWWKSLLFQSEWICYVCAYTYTSTEHKQKKNKTNKTGGKKSDLSPLFFFSFFPKREERRASSFSHAISDRQKEILILLVVLFVVYTIINDTKQDVSSLLSTPFVCTVCLLFHITNGFLTFKLFFFFVFVSFPSTTWLTSPSEQESNLKVNIGSHQTGLNMVVCFCLIGKSGAIKKTRPRWG